MSIPDLVLADPRTLLNLILYCETFQRPLPMTYRVIAGKLSFTPVHISNRTYEHDSISYIYLYLELNTARDGEATEPIKVRNPHS